MADRDDEELLEWVEQLQTENAGLRRELLLADSIVTEFRQTLAETQFALARANAQLKYANQPTA